MEIQRTTTIPEVKETIVKLRHLNADERARQEAYYREKRLHDEATALGHARREGFQEGFKQGFQQGYKEGFQQGYKEGLQIGRLQALAKLVEKGILTVPQAAEKANMSVSEFEEKVGAAEL